MGAKEGLLMPSRVFLKDELSKGELGLKQLSKRISAKQVCLNFKDVYSLSESEIQALFSHLQADWDYSDFDHVFDTESFGNEKIEEEISSAISKHIAEGVVSKSSSESKSVSPSKSDKLSKGKITVQRDKISKVMIGLILIGLVSGTFIFKFLIFLNGNRFSQPTLVIGAVNSRENYILLQKHLQKELIPSSFWQYLLGKKIEISLDAGTNDRDMPYPQAITSFKDQNWDVGFAYSPVVGMAAVDSGYVTVAVMFPDSSDYQSSIFVRQDSPIQSFDDINESQTIALGDFFSASKFYMPVYELYGKRLRVVSNIPTNEIFELVRSGKVEIGVGVIEDLQSEQDLRVIRQSRNIPGAGVYFSPKLSLEDSISIQNSLLSASDEIRSHQNANYGIGNEPDFQQFRGIIQRVREVTACSDFNKNPVNFFCNNQTQVLSIEGRINGVERSGDDYLLRVFDYNRNVCRLQVSSELLAEVQSYDTPFDFQGYYVNASVGVQEETKCEQDSVIKIFQPNQLELTRRGRH